MQEHYKIINSRFGFTLMELMVTIAIIAVLSAIATPNVIGWRNNAQFSAAVRQVKSSIESTRMAAIRTSLPADVLFDGTNSYGTRTWTIVAGLPVQGAAVTNQTGPGVSISSNNGNQLTFNNRGMAANTTVTIQHTNGLSRQIVVDITGSSRIQ